jgi:aminoglycoside phosphotransferase (APT) family kinase protein
MDTTADMDIAAIIRQATGQKVAAKHRITLGESSEVYKVELANNSTVVLRLSSDNDNRYAAEAWAIEQARNVGVPAPRVISVGSRALETGTKHFSVEGFITGETFDNLVWRDRIPRERAHAIAVQAGALLARLHQVNVTGWGPLDETGRGAYLAADRWVAAELNTADRIAALFQAAGLETPLLHAVLERLDTATNLFGAPPHLLHMDYGPKHVFVDGSDKIVGIIDFEQATGGDIAFDFNGWPFWREETEAATKWMLEGYTSIAPLGDNFDERLAVARLYNRIGLLHYATGPGTQPKWAAAAAHAIRELMKGF